MRIQPRVVAALIVILILLTSCAALTRLSTGRLLDDVGQTFHEQAKLWDRAHATGDVSPAEYAQFVRFAESFQVTYAALERAWQRGEDPVVLSAEVRRLKNDLTLWVLKQSRRKP